MADAVCCHPNGVCVDDGCEVCKQPLPGLAPTNEELAYTAGIIDGEGCISIVRKPYKTAGFPTNYELYVKVQTADKIICPWLHIRFGGSLGMTKGYNGNRRCHTWGVSSASAELFLRAILPWLRLKRAEAELGIEFRKTKVAPGHYIGDVVRQQRADLFEQMKALKEEQRWPTP